MSPAAALHLGTIVQAGGASYLEAELATIADGAIAVGEDGKILALGKRPALLARFPTTPRVAHPDALIVPGFVDLHVHYPQVRVVASHGEELLPWLRRYVFPEEARFARASYARAAAKRFVDHALGAGTTTALVVGSHVPTAMNALFSEMLRRGLGGASGLVLMDRDVPAALRGRTERLLEATAALADRWHGRGRIEYVLLPRFAPTSTPRLLNGLGALAAARPELLVHTHVSENPSEVECVRRLFPRAASYVDVYDQAGLLGPRTLLAHGVHLSRRELGTLAERRTRVVHCPSSNFFLGSGLFPAARLAKAGIAFGLGTDVGAGTSFCQLRTMADHYRMQAVQGERPRAAQLLWTATKGGGLALGQPIGRLTRGSWADFVVLDAADNALLADREAAARTLEERLFAYQLLGDERAVRFTFTSGRMVFARGARIASRERSGT